MKTLFLVLSILMSVSVAQAESLEVRCQFDEGRTAKGSLSQYGFHVDSFTLFNGEQISFGDGPSLAEYPVPRKVIADGITVFDMVVEPFKDGCQLVILGEIQSNRKNVASLICTSRIEFLRSFRTPETKTFMGTCSFTN